MLRLLDGLETEGQLHTWHLPIEYWGHSGEKVISRWLSKYDRAVKTNKRTRKTVVLDGHSAWVNYTAHVSATACACCVRVDACLRARASRRGSALLLPMPVSQPLPLLPPPPPPSPPLLLQGRKQPTFINIVREPVSRIKSLYYYMHAPGRHHSNSSSIALARLFGDRVHDPVKHSLTNCLSVQRCRDFVVRKYALQPMRQVSQRGRNCLTTRDT
jgi:hypothetical protein